MGFVKTTGVVIRSTRTGENDRVLTLLTETNGRVQAYAHLSRKGKGSVAGASQLLCFSEFELFEGRNMYNLDSAAILEPFSGIGQDIVRLTYAAHLCELVYDVVQEEQPATEILRLFLNTLHMLSKTDRSPSLLAEIFEFKLLELAGFTGSAAQCGCCCADLEERAYFSRTDCAVFCPECAKTREGIPALSSGAVRALSHIGGAVSAGLFAFDVSPEVLGELQRITDAFLKQFMEKQYKKLDILKSLQ